MSGWQDIAGAPQADGEFGPDFIAAEYLLLDVWNMVLVRMTASGGLVHSWDHSPVKREEFAPTHWHPLPGTSTLSRPVGEEGL